VRFDRARDQRQLAGVSDPALLGDASGRRRDRVAPGLSGGGRRWKRLQGPDAAAAIANAVFDALGIRVRELPLTGERIRAAIG
jgi:hypothetical protein